MTETITRLSLISICIDFYRLRSFGVKPILDYSVEEDISQEEAEKREVEWVLLINSTIDFWCLNRLSFFFRVFFVFRSSVSSAGDCKEEGAMPQYHVDKSFADRRYKVSSARTYFYLNEATCERNMEIFIKCLEAVSGMSLERCLSPTPAPECPLRFLLISMISSCINSLGI